MDYILECIEKDTWYVCTLVGGVDLQRHVTLLAFKVVQSLYCAPSSISQGVVNYMYFPGLWGIGISVVVFKLLSGNMKFKFNIIVLLLGV